jgi:hypothetical protein
VTTSRTIICTQHATAMADKVFQYHKRAHPAPQPSVVGVAGRVTQHVSSQHPAVPIVSTLMAQRVSGSYCGSLPDRDPKLIKAKFLVTNDDDGATTTHMVFLEREQICRASATGVTMLLGRLTGIVEANRLFFMRGSLELADGSALPFADTALLKRYAGLARLLTVEALLV